VFVQSRDGNTVASDPATLGGGETDKHLIYEGLSRVDADAVMAGAGTARSEDMVFSIWHPELVSLRLGLGHARHPAQVLVSGTGNLPVERGLMFTEPTLRVFVVTRSSSVAMMRNRVAGRPWVEVIDAGEPLSLTIAMDGLHRRGLKVISAVGGRRTATALLREGLVSDLYLTTSPVAGGEPNTPLYEGPRLALSRVIAKAGQGTEAGVRFEHFMVPPVPV
jgi:riboflavin biosynthesis pyrimidine reductase